MHHICSLCINHTWAIYGSKTRLACAHHNLEATSKEYHVPLWINKRNMVISLKTLCVDWFQQISLVLTQLKWQITLAVLNSETWFGVNASRKDFECSIFILNVGKLTFGYNRWFEGSILNMTREDCWVHCHFLKQIPTLPQTGRGEKSPKAVLQLDRQTEYCFLQRSWTSKNQPPKKASLSLRVRLSKTVWRRRLAYCVKTTC